MITNKEKTVNHPINYVHTDLESFVLYSDSFNDVNSQVVEVEEIPKIIENFEEVLKKERQRLDSTGEKSAFQQQQNNDGQHGKVKEQIEFQHLEEDKAGLWSTDFDGTVGREGELAFGYTTLFSPQTECQAM